MKYHRDFLKFYEEEIKSLVIPEIFHRESMLREAGSPIETFGDDAQSKHSYFNEQYVQALWPIFERDGDDGVFGYGGVVLCK